MLKNSELAHFGARLEAEQRALLARLEDLDQRLARGNQYNTVGDLGDDANEILDHEEILSLRNMVSERLAQNARALDRIKNGSYGYSEISGEPIPIERLNANPSATTLVSEQS